MSRGANIDFVMVQGKTFSQVFRWGAEPIQFKSITALDPLPPATFEVIGHGLVDGWPVSVIGAPWAKTLVAKSEPPTASEIFETTVIDEDHISFQGVSTIGWTFKAGGFIRFFTPIPLTDYTARMQIRDAPDGELFISLTSENGEIILDNLSKTITITIPEIVTKAQLWDKAVYDLELANGEYVMEIAYGKITLPKEVTHE